MILGCMPSVGSSNKSNFGRVISVRAIANCCCWPTDKSPPLRFFICLRIGNNSKIGAFTEIQKEVIIGENCKICTNTVICTGVVISDNCFIGNGTIFINDNHPKAVNEKNELESWLNWKERFREIVVENNVSIGSNCTIRGGVTIGKGASIGAGSMVVKNVPDGEVWAGNPAKRLY